MSYDRISENGFTIATANNNELSVNGDSYNSNIDTLRSFLVLPVTSLELISDSNLSAYDVEGETGFADLDVKLQNGLYCNRALELNLQVSSASGLVNASSAYDKNKTSYASFDVHMDFPFGSYLTYDYMFAKALKFGLPEIPSDINIDSVYLGLKMKSQWGYFPFLTGDNRKTIYALMKRFLYTKPVDRVMSGLIFNEQLTANYIDNIPDFYAINGDGDNANFFRESTPTGGIYNEISGYTLSGAFQFTGLTREIYNTYSHGALIIRHYLNHASPDDRGLNEDDFLKIYELALIIKLSDQNIKSSIFSPLSGRIFNDTWGTRKTAANLIQKPIDILEHACRLQDWSETGETGTEWGKEYATTAKIKTGAGLEGSFDHANLNTLTDQTPAFQIFDEAKAYTDELKKLICRVYDVCTYIDQDGKECVETMALINPAETITIDDLMTDPEEIEEPKTELVYCEPVVNYQYNVGSGDYDKTLRVYNIQASAEGGAWTASSSGFANQTDAEAVLGIYAALWERFHTVEKCPSDFSDMIILQSYADALAYIKRKGNAMGKRRQRVIVNYSKGKDYHFAKHVMLNLPHQTNGQDVECMIENMTASKNENRVELNLLLLEDIPTS
jgi:hypothetical protein